MERLTGRSANGTAIYSKPSRDPVKWRNNRRDVLCKLAEYEDLEEQGLLLRLPCKVGDTVYTNTRAVGWYMREKDKPYKARIAFMGINGKCDFVNVVYKNDNMLQFKFSDFGKRVFLTREEAEAALHIQGEITVNQDNHIKND